MVSEIVWEPDLWLEPGQGERAVVGSTLLQVWRSGGRVWYDAWDTSRDEQMLEDSVPPCLSLDHFEEAKRRVQNAVAAFVSRRAS